MGDNYEDDKRVVDVKIEKIDTFLNNYEATVTLANGNVGVGKGVDKKQARENATLDARNSRCFLTTACVHYANKTDDCYELTLLRNFRDTYVISLINGKELLDEYYRTAPIIVNKINNSENRESEYKMMLNEISRIITKIEENNSSDAVLEYTQMFDRLRKAYV